MVVLISILPFTTSAREEIKEIDLSLLSERGMLLRVLTDGRPVWIAYRTKKAINIIRERAHIRYPNDPVGINNEFRSFNKNYFIVFGGCPTIEELPAYYPDEGFVCNSSCGKFDMSGRPVNDCAGSKPMEIPKHHYKNEKVIIIPIHQDGNT